MPQHCQYLQNNTQIIQAKEYKQETIHKPYYKHVVLYSLIYSIPELQSIHPHT